MFTISVFTVLIILIKISNAIISILYTIIYVSFMLKLLVIFVNKYCKGKNAVRRVNNMFIRKIFNTSYRTLENIACLNGLSNIEAYYT